MNFLNPTLVTILYASLMLGFIYIVKETSCGHMATVDTDSNMALLLAKWWLAR